MQKMRLISALALAAGAVSFAGIAKADIGGGVKLTGAAPEAAEVDMTAVKECAEQHADPVTDPSVMVGEGGGLANVIVSIKTDDPTSLGGEASSDPVTLDQVGCMYEPHVLSMTAGQDFVVKNSDPFLHNVHSLAVINPAFNFGQPNKDPGKKVPDAPKAAEVFRVKCDVHPWMSAYIGVFEHPFHAVTGEDGKFEIKGKVPDGDYTLMAWHEKYGEQEQAVTIKDGKPAADVAFSFDAASAMAEPVTGEVIVAAATVSKGKDAKECEDAKSCCEAAKKVSRSGEEKDDAKKSETAEEKQPEKKSAEQAKASN